jgi:type IV pilus assembly protein PilV
MLKRHRMTLPPFARLRPARQRVQGGAMLIEALIAILIFSIGILGIVGLQAAAVQQSSDARYRAQAAELAQQLFGQMWTGDRTATTLQTQYNCTPPCASAGAGYQTWYAQVTATMPGVGSDPSLKPFVSVDSTGIVKMILYWRQPSDQSGSSHQYKVQSQIGQ